MSRRFRGFTIHAFPTCFVCGPVRAPGDGLRIFPGGSADDRLVGAPWVPDRSLTGADGRIGPEVLWSALDCPGYFAVAVPGERAVLGRMTAEVDPTIAPGERCVVVGWPIARSGRKLEAGTALYDESGTRETEERRYFLLPGSGAGSAGTNYDATKFAYDDEGHRIRTKEASGTIRRTTYDIFERAIDQYIGTNDYGSAGGESSGPANMVKTEHLVYDGGSAGLNGLLTSRTLYVEDGTTPSSICL